MIVNFLDDDLRAYETTVVFNENIDRVDILGSDENESRLDLIRKRLDSLFVDADSSTHANATASNVQRFDSAELTQARDRLVKWLEKNRLSVKLEEGDKNQAAAAVVINILDSVFIHAPYTAESCVSTNEIILNRVRNLINNCSI